MSNLNQFTGGARVPRALINNISGSTGVRVDVVGASISSVNTSAMKKSVSGALTAGVLSTVLSLTGSGAVSFLACTGVDTTSRTHRFKLTVDGVEVFDGTTIATTQAHEGILLIGSLVSISSFSVPIHDPIPYNSSFLLEYASSLTETGKTDFGYVYRTY